MQHSLAPSYLIARTSSQQSSTTSKSGHITSEAHSEVQLANLASCPSLRTAEAILQSIISALTPNRKYKEMTLTLAQQAVDVTTEIMTLIEATKDLEVLHRTNYIPQLEELLHEIRLFVQTETQRNLFHRLLLRQTISIRYIAIERRLASVLKAVEQCKVEIQASKSTRGGMCGGVSTKAELECSALSQASSSSANNADVVVRNEMFSNAHDFIITGGQFYIQNPSSQGIVPELRVVPFEDISINQEIYKTPIYRLHSENSSGRARVLKVFQGSRAKERAQETARFHKKVMHPSFLHIVGVSPLNCEVPFLVFNGGFEGTLEVNIAKALKKDLRKSLILGLRTVIGLSSGLDYLRDVAYPFINAGSQHFCAFLNLEGEVMINFDPDIAYEQNDLNVDEQLSLLKMDKPLLIFHELCQQTFDAACRAHYGQQQVERTYNDTMETEDYGHEDLQGTASTSVVSSTNVSSKKLLGKLPIDGHRRELVWKSQNEKNSSLQDICLEFKAFLDSLTPSSEPALHRRRGRYTVRTAHRCPGYNRTEITLTPSITRSAIVSHSTPLPHEICPVCDRVVQDVEIFDCICGEEDDESVPTIQCSKCCKWHHQHCVKSTARSFLCPDCCGTESKGKSSKHALVKQTSLPELEQTPSLPDELSVAEEVFVPVKIVWKGAGTQVVLARAGNEEWNGREAMEKESANAWTTTVTLRPGVHHVRFLVDGHWHLADDLPLAVDDQGLLSNYIAVPIPVLT